MFNLSVGCVIISNNNINNTILSLMYEYIHLNGNYFILENMYFSKVEYRTNT